MDTLTMVINKHAPIKLASRRKSKLLAKPWITNGIFKSIKVKLPFSFIYNQSIRMGVVPDLFKISRITPIYKSGDITDPNN